MGRACPDWRNSPAFSQPPRVDTEFRPLRQRSYLQAFHALPHGPEDRMPHGYGPAKCLADSASRPPCAATPGRRLGPWRIDIRKLIQTDADTSREFEHEARVKIKCLRPS